MKYDYDRRKVAKMSTLQLYEVVERLAQDARLFLHGGYTRRGQKVRPLDRNATPNDLMEAMFAARDQMARAKKALPELPTDEAKRQFGLAIRALESVVRAAEPVLHDQPADAVEMAHRLSSALMSFRIALMEVEDGFKAK